MDDKFKATVSLYYGVDAIGMLDTDLTAFAVSLPPNAPALYNEKGELNWENSTWINPLANLERRYKGNTESLVSNGTVSYLLLEGFQIRTNIGYTNMNVRETQMTPLSSINPEFRKGRTGFSILQSGYTKTWIVEPQLEYSFKFPEGLFTAYVGTTFQEKRTEASLIEGSGYTSDALLGNISAAPDVTILSSQDSDYRYTSLFGRINYVHNAKYILNITSRRDGSSRFGPSKRFANFGALGAAWVFTEENFILKNLPFLSFGKIRASIGITGSDQIGDYQYLDTYSSTRYPYHGNPGIIPTRMANSNFAWESNRKSEIGLDVVLFKNTISLSTSWYRNLSSDQLVGMSLPTQTGANSVIANFEAEVENKGWEFSLTSNNVSKSNFEWSTNANITLPENTLLNYPGLEASPYAFRYVVGKSLNVVPAIQVSRVDSQSGLYTFVDLDDNGSGTDIPGDLSYELQTDQTYYGGLENSLRYKGISFSFLLQFVKQNGFNYLQDFSNPPGSQYNQPSVVMNRWRQEGDNSEIEQFLITSPTYRFYRESTASVSDASFVRLTNVYVSWTLPTKLKECRIYAQGQNIFTITNYLGLNPESRSSISLPPLRTITIGLQLTL